MLPLLSVVCSQKSNLPRHRERLEFLEALRARLADRLVIKGRGFSAIKDKAEAIDAYRYHLVLENNDVGFHWTEKLADPLLGWALPIFMGPPGAIEDFPAESLVYLDLADIDGAIEAIVRLLDEDPYEKHISAIAEARTRILDVHNVFALLSRTFDQLRSRHSFPGPLSAAVWITPQASVASRLLKKLRRRLRLAYRRSKLAWGRT